MWEEANSQGSPTGGKPTLKGPLQVEMGIGHFFLVFSWALRNALDLESSSEDLQYFLNSSEVRHGELDPPFFSILQPPFQNLA